MSRLSGTPSRSTSSRGQDGGRGGGRVDQVDVPKPVLDGVVVEHDQLRGPSGACGQQPEPVGAAGVEGDHQPAARPGSARAASAGPRRAGSAGWPGRGTARRRTTRPPGGRRRPCAAPAPAASIEPSASASGPDVAGQAHLSARRQAPRRPRPTPPRDGVTGSARRSRVRSMPGRRASAGKSPRWLPPAGRRAPVPGSSSSSSPSSSSSSPGPGPVRVGVPGRYGALARPGPARRRRRAPAPPGPRWPRPVGHRVRRRTRATGCA